ncbi:30S ribosomal protein S8e [Nanoarchaeota archaeon]|nr:MAG: 30S ribosomal protein S8e [Nanoarchaeota archaeon]
MALSQRRSRRKVTGGKYKKQRDKKKMELAGREHLTRIGEKRVTLVRMRGGKLKTKALSLDKANVYDPKSKTYKVVSIKSVIENKANRHYVRRQIITKGAIIETDLGKAIVTNRPSQEGFINAKLI